MYLLDGRRRRVVWHTAVSGLLRSSYASREEAAKHLADRFGLDAPALLADPLFQGRAPAGHLLAFARPLARLGVSLPSDFRLPAFGGRHGWVDLDRVPAALRARAGLG